MWNSSDENSKLDWPVIISALLALGMFIGMCYSIYRFNQDREQFQLSMDKSFYSPCGVRYRATNLDQYLFASGYIKNDILQHYLENKTDLIYIITENSIIYIEKKNLIDLTLERGDL